MESGKELPEEVIGAQWRESSFASEKDKGVEVAMVDDRIVVRDAKDRDGPMLVFTPEEWEAFLGGVRGGEFD
jgi:hypothetical protein